MAQLQGELLQRAGGWLVAGGRLVYSVCSMEPEEGEAQAARVALSPDPVDADELPAGLIPDRFGQVRTDPGLLAPQGGLDGFFIARFRAE